MTENYRNPLITVHFLLMHYRNVFTLIKSLIVVAITSILLVLVAVALRSHLTVAPSPTVTAPPPPFAAASSSPPSSTQSTALSAATTTVLSTFFPRNIAYGDTGSDVKLLQTILKSLGYLPASYIPTTIFNLQTQHALLLFQSDHDLNMSGFLDLQSQALMDKIAGSLAAAPSSHASLLPTTTLANLIPNPPPPSSAGAFSFTGVTVSNITGTSSEVTVTMNEPASITLSYGPTTMYGGTTAPSPNLTTVYENLANLTPNTPYDFIVAATPANATSPISSENYVFVTAGSSTPPVPPPATPAPTSSPDTVPPPTVSILSPTNDAQASGTVMVTAGASDNVGVTAVSLYVDNAVAATLTSSPYVFSLNTASLADGPHTISLKAYDAAGNVGTSPSILIFTDNAPETLAASLSVSPSSGIAPLEASLTASVSGTAQGTINFIFYCNQNTTNTSVTSPADLTVDGATVTTYTANNVCTYSAPGTYTAKVIVEEGSAPPAEAEETVVVAAGAGTTAPSSTPLIMSGVQVSQLTDDSAQIAIAATGASSVEVSYGLTTNYGSATAALVDIGDSLLYTATLPDLQPDTLYHYRVTSTGPGGNTVTSEDQVLLTQAVTAPAQFTSTSLPPFQLTVTGDSQIFLPNSAFHCETPQSLPNEPQEPKVDGPDGPVNTFRDSTDLIHLFIPGGFNFQFTGTSFNDLTQDCNSVYLSHWNIDPSQYQYNEWVRAPYSIDGTNVYGIVHDEYHCATAEPGSTSNCVYEALTQANSDDGGDAFTESAMPERLVATVPYQEQDIPPSTTGVGDNSNIIENPNDGYYYMEATEHSNGVGPCMFRSSDLSNWYAWNGTSFSVAMNGPTENSCTPITTYPLLGPGNIRYVPRYNIFLGIGGLANSYYYMVSNDLVHWSAPVFLFAPNTFAYVTSTWQTGDLLPSKFFYFSLVDPDSADLNFNVINFGDSLSFDTIQQPSVIDSAGVIAGNVLDRSVIEYPLSLLPAVPQAASAPSIIPAAGSYNQNQTIIMSCSNPSNAIYYTTNGSTPTASTALSTQYVGPIAVSASETIKAICVADNYGISAVSEAQYGITSSTAPTTL